MTESPITYNLQPKTSRGILLIALGAPEYGWMAANLAASIRYGDKDVPIHLVWSDRSISQLSDAHKKLFTSMAECPAEYYTRRSTVNSQQSTATAQSTVNGQQSTGQPSPVPRPPSLEYIKAKTHLYDLTPFDETLFLDVDMYILPHVRISNIINSLSEKCDYTIKNRGCPPAKGAYAFWFDLDEAKDHFKTKNKFYQSQSEFVFFKKTDIMQLFFDEVRNIFDHPPIPSVDFRGGVSDEYAFNLAMAANGIYPHEDNYIPVYWPFLEGRHDWNKVIVQKYIGFSLGGENIPEWLNSKVNAYKQLYRQSLKLPHLFNVPPKRRWNVKRRVG
jgi:hypothetical protein